MKKPLLWHHISHQALLTQLEVDRKMGLTEFEAKQRLEKWGFNQLTPQRGKSSWQLIIEQFNQPLVYILLAAVGVTAFLKEWVDCSVIFGVVLINAIIGFIQESNALKAIDALR